MKFSKRILCAVSAGIICTTLFSSTYAKTLHTYEFPKDYTEEEGQKDGFKITNGFHACIEKGKLSTIATFGMPITFISPEFNTEGAKYMLFSLKSQMKQSDSTVKVTLKSTDGAKEYTANLKDTSRNLYAFPIEQDTVTGFEIAPQIEADFTDMYAVELDFVRFLDTSTLVYLKIGNNEIFDGKQTLATDAPALIKNDRTLTPARCVAEALGANVEWDEQAREVTITKGDRIIKLSIDSDIALVDGKEQKLDVSAQIIGDRTYTPARFVAEKLGYAVDWDAETQSVIITEH